MAKHETAMDETTSDTIVTTSRRREGKGGSGSGSGRCHQQQRLRDRWPTILMLVLLASLMLSWHEAEANSVHRRFYRRAVRLCSKNLSDALYLICKDRGYNEPFSNSGESEAVRHTTGPGLVEECCYNACSLEQMEQYCKPISKSG